MADYEQTIEEEIPGNIYVFAVIDDEENEYMPAVISHVDDYELPDHFVREDKAGGGVCTYALLKALEAMNPQDGSSRKKKLTWAEALEFMHAEIEDEGGRGSLPTLSTSRPINVREERLRLISTSKNGVKRALLVGSHYQDEKDENVWLESCHTDVRRIRHHLIHEEGFEKENILVMMDDDRHHEPTKNLILDALERMCQISEAGDSIFFHFSGHGGTLMNEDEYDEEGIMHELLAPGDFREDGVLIDDELYSSFVTKVPEGVHAVAVIDTCHPASSRSGKSSALDLPYVCEAGEDEIRASEGFRPGRMLMASAAGVAAIAAGTAAVLPKSKKKKKQKKKKLEEEVEDETQEPSSTYGDGSYEEESPNQKKKSKKKKKKKEESQNEQSYSEGGQEEEKPKKKKKKPKKK